MFNLRFARALPRSLSAAVVGLFGLFATSSGLHADDASPPIVLELFTSQGCSSCPPADALLHEYAKTPGVIALSLSVDYWDRLGWKDTFGSPAYSDRQRKYAIKRGDQEVYTPQIVVNGLYHTVGSSRSRVNDAIQRAKKALGSQTPRLTAKRVENKLVLSITPAASATPETYSVLVAKILPLGTVRIKRGENAGRTIGYRNVVKSLDRIGTWDGKAQSLELPFDQPTAGKGDDTIAVLLQKGVRGAIVGAAYVAQES